MIRKEVADSVKLSIRRSHVQLQHPATSKLQSSFYDKSTSIR
ncbi:hypothetical protein [Virgibacillus halodenitrificans]|nr:hypothetical protein [Virgibacillus halodenitrificans]